MILNSVSGASGEVQGVSDLFDYR
ncbi:protein of unknown function [uncultured Woeseiaceae bacterium]|uniref:Uncharacterized protein n=1 Tax=uncultured Woeseiaceae bacterium TaxID=1983305 RepID=A0A7D9D1Q5_9GAMM|nr:protein of unknown function [uncultured Woeseiaceae bacterium]